MIDCVAWLARWLCRLAGLPFTVFLRDPDAAAGFPIPSPEVGGTDTRTGPAARPVPLVLADGEHRPLAGANGRSRSAPATPSGIHHYFTPCIMAFIFLTNRKQMNEATAMAIVM